jgi:16S rRNA (adenine1518-N6/adenine1519-N6)-dimethyltransferase
LITVPRSSSPAAAVPTPGSLFEAVAEAARMAARMALRPMKGHVARKRFGQNFLVDQGIIAAIVSAIDPQRADTVVEIGPGLGALTEPLLARLDHLHVVEIDRDLIARLKKQHPPGSVMAIHEGDALAFDFATYRQRPAPGRQSAVQHFDAPAVSSGQNTSAACATCISCCKKRLSNAWSRVPGDSSDFSRISVMLQYRFHLEWLIDVPPESFEPPPKVQSAVVRLIPQRRKRARCQGARRSSVASGPDGLLTAPQDVA